MSVRRIRKNDTVTVISGDEAGKKGKVLDVMSEKCRAVVEGLNLVKRTLKKTKENPKGGTVTKEAPIAISKLVPFCPTCKKGVKIKGVEEAGRKIRKCRACGHPFDS